jgi:hypothetical protein
VVDACADLAKRLVKGERVASVDDDTTPEMARLMDSWVNNAVKREPGSTVASKNNDKVLIVVGYVSVPVLDSALMTVLYQNILDWEGTNCQRLVLNFHVKLKVNVYSSNREGGREQSLLRLPQAWLTSLPRRRGTPRDAD